MLVMPAFSQTTAELERRAKIGNTEAQVALGVKYENGIVSEVSSLPLYWPDRGTAQGVLQDYLEAVKWYRAAAYQGDPMGQLNLGRMYLFGRGVSENKMQAHKWCNLAALKLTGEDGDRAIRCRHRATFGVSTRDVNLAQRLATEWKPKPWEVIRKELKIGPLE